MQKLKIKNKKIIIIFLIIFLNSLFQSICNAKEIFDLKKSIETALKNNLQMKQAVEKLNYVRGKITEAKSYKLPQLSLSSSYTRLNEASSANFPMYTPPLSVYTTDPSEQGTLTEMGAQAFPDYIQQTSGQTLPFAFPGNYVIPPRIIPWNLYFSDINIYNHKLTLQQTIYTFGKVETGIRLTKLNLKSQEIEYRKTKDEIIFNVKKAYFGVLQAKHFVEVATSALNTLKEHLKVVQEFEKEGVVAGYDVLRVESALANTEQLLITAENAESLAKTGLAILLGQGYKPEEIEIEDNGEWGMGNGEWNLEDLIKEGFKNRPEILQLKENIKMAEGSLKLARLNNKPALVLIGNYEYKKGDELPSKWRDSWNATLALSFPFLDSGQTRGKIGQSKAQLEQANIGLEQLKQGIELEVRQAYLNLKEAEKKIEVAKKQIITAEEGLRIAKERYKAGVGTSVEVMDDQNALTQAQTNYYNAMYEYQVALAKLQKAIGKEE